MLMKMDLRTFIVVSLLLANLFIYPAVCQEEQETTNKSVWTPGRITQVTLAIIESALLTLLLIYPNIMDPAINFINRGIGAMLTRKRRETRDALIENAAAIHDLFLDAIETFESLDETLSSL